MKTSIAAVLGAAFTVGTALLPTPAHAVCTVTIYAERAVSTAATTQLLGRASSAATNGWFGTATDPEIQNAISAAVSQRNRVTATGSAVVCPPLPASGFANIGAITALIISP